MHPDSPDPHLTPPAPTLPTQVLDGWGESEYHDKFNAIHAAETPAMDELRASAPGRWRLIKAHGTAVGLPSDADMGNSEVGHNALGAGQIVDQGAKCVDRSLETGEVWSGEGWRAIQDSARAGTLHLIGLLSDGGVHSRYDQLQLLMEGAVRQGVRRIRLHALSDGRDVGENTVGGGGALGLWVWVDLKGLRLGRWLQTQDGRGPILGSHSCGVDPGEDFCWRHPWGWRQRTCTESRNPPRHPSLAVSGLVIPPLLELGPSADRACLHMPPCLHSTSQPPRTHKQAVKWVTKAQGDIDRWNSEHGIDIRIASGGGRMHVTMDRYESDWAVVKAGYYAHVLGEAPNTYTSAIDAVTDLKVGSLLMMGKGPRSVPLWWGVVCIGGAKVREWLPLLHTGQLWSTGVPVQPGRDTWDHLKSGLCVQSARRLAHLTWPSMPRLTHL